MTITIGADPEVFLKRNGQFISADGIIPGTKERPEYVRFGAVQLDGIAAEFNIDCATTRTMFISNIGRVMESVSRYARQHEAEVCILPVADFEEKYFSSLRPETLELGCNPDFNGWDIDINPMPEGDRPFRTGSGHVHVGLHDFSRSMDPNDIEYFETCCAIVRQMDYYLGLPSLLWDQDNRRRELYGKAGAFRPKNYGLEYRVLSNLWLTSTELQGFVFDRARWAVIDYFKGKRIEEQHGNLAREIIDNNILNWREVYPQLNSVVIPEGF